ncbi:MAG: helix-turn-helix domain-containing protein [Anaerolineales bacterium]|nr:helix-turn-helix domain-containing protein [Anaerolineales bacterium]
MSLGIFGQKLRELRKSSGLTQASLARQLPTTAEMISIWERAYQHRGRRWVPDRSSALRLVEIFADQLTPQEAQQWLSLLGYKLGQAELQRFFPGEDIPTSSSASPSANSQAILKRLAALPDQRLFGVSVAQQQLRLFLEQTDAPWLISIDGIGGIGKTSLAAAIAREIMPTNRFEDMAWISAKQEEFLPQIGLEPTSRSALDTDTLANSLLGQLDPNLSLARSTEEKKLLLTHLLKERPYLIVVDNLETAADYQTLLPFLRQLANPTKFLLTSRHSLHAYSEAFCLTLKELNQVDALALLQYEAEIRGVTALTSASETQRGDIYGVVGGNPLALKLVVGQLYVLPLSQVLESLKQARSKTVDDLYTYIYWQAWHTLDKTSQEVLLVMPLAQGGTFEQLITVSEIEISELNQALAHLVKLSLVEVSGDLEQRRYRIHRLTETFLMNEVVKWRLHS